MVEGEIRTNVGFVVHIFTFLAALGLETFIETVLPFGIFGEETFPFAEKEATFFDVPRGALKSAIIYLVQSNHTKTNVSRVAHLHSQQLQL